MEIGSIMTLAGDLKVMEPGKWVEEFPRMSEAERAEWTTAFGARNEAFYFATCDELALTLAALKRALALEPEATRGYIDDEIELDRFRDSVEMRALLA